MEPSSDKIGRAYVELALAIDQHLPGYIDAYYGPAEWKDTAIAQGKRPLGELATQVSRLERVAKEEANLDPLRSQFLEKHLQAMGTTISLLQGATLSLAMEVEALYDITPTWVSEARFKEAHVILDELLPPGGSLQERMQFHRKSLEIPVERAKPVVSRITEHLRALTQESFPLPDDEHFDLQYVTDQPWAAYNWYLGDCRSRIDINTDLPLRINALTGLIAHEGYPGHHTELSIKETRLLQGAGQLEHSLALINAPSCVISEGIATQALDAIMSESEQIAWHAEQVFPLGGFQQLDAQREHEIGKATQELSRVSGNAAFMLHDQGAQTVDVTGYLQHYGLMEEKRAHKMVDFIRNPLFRSYIFTYSYGRELLGELFNQKGDAQQWFLRLLTEPVTPSQIQQWMVE